MSQSGIPNASFQLRYAGFHLLEFFTIEADVSLQTAALLQVPQSLPVLPLAMDFTVLRAIEIFFVLPLAFCRSEGLSSKSGAKLRESSPITLDRNQKNANFLHFL